MNLSIQSVTPQGNPPPLKFERVLRDCDYNKRLQAEYAGSGTAPHLIYDFKVLINGEFRALLNRRTAGPGYVVYDADHQPIAPVRNVGRTIVYGGHAIEFISKQSGFEFAIQRLLTEGAIPTLGELVVRQEQREAAERKALADREERVRVDRIKDAGVDLYEALKALLRCSAIPERWAAPALEAIAKAEGRS